MAWLGVSSLPLKAATATSPAARYIDTNALTTLLDQFPNWRGAVNAGANTLSNVSTLSVNGSATANSVRAVGSLADVRVMHAGGGVGFRFHTPGDGTMHCQRSLDGFATLDQTPIIFNADGSVRFGSVGVGGSPGAYQVHIKGAGTPHLRVSDSVDNGYSLFRNATDGIFTLSGNQNTFCGYKFMLSISSVSTEVVSIRSQGRLYLGVCPTFANDSAAGSGGVAAGELWQTNDGILRRKL